MKWFYHRIDKVHMRKDHFYKMHRFVFFKRLIFTVDIYPSQTCFGFMIGYTGNHWTWIKLLPKERSMNDLEKYLEEVKQRVEAATEGPWNHEQVEGDEEHIIQTKEGTVFCNWADMSRNNCNLNSRFIANARTDVPRLIAIIEKIQERGCLIDADYRELDEIARGDNE